MKKWHVWLAVVVGLAVTVGMMVNDFNFDALADIELSARFFLGMMLAAGCFVAFNLMYSFRFAYLTQHRLSLRKCLRVTVLCEFASAATPSAVGGSGLSFVYLNREGVSMGRSIFTMFAALLADETFLAVTSLLGYVLVPARLLFCTDGGVAVGGHTAGWVLNSVRAVFLLSVLAVAAWTVVLFVLLLCKPRALGWVLGFCCRTPWLQRFRPRVEKFADDMALASTEARREGTAFWVRLMGYTAGAWSARFAIVVAILFAFGVQGNLLVAWLRQWGIWMISIVSPTPGGSGIAELMFRCYYADFLPVPSLVVLAAMVWRLFSYYPYLIMGAVALPKWLKQSLLSKQKSMKD
jgi:glycosyltransferase 2 family protein